MKKILFVFLTILTLFFTTNSVSASSSLDTLTFTREDFTELYRACVDKYDINTCSNYRFRYVVYNSGIDQEYGAILANTPPEPPTITLYMALNNITFHSDGIWTTFDNRNVDKGFLDISSGLIVKKFLNDGTFYIYKFPGLAAYSLGPMETYSKNWLFLMSDTNIEYKGQVLFDIDNNYDVSGSIQTGSGVIDNVSKSLIERIWDTIKGIFNSIISLPEKIFDSIISFFSGFVIEESAFNEKFNILMSDIDNKFGFISQTFNILIDLFKRFLNINSGNHIINIPEIKEPFYGKTLINRTSFDFDIILTKNNISSLHSIYLSFVDVIILFSLLKYGRKQFDKIFGGVKQ